MRVHHSDFLVWVLSLKQVSLRWRFVMLRDVEMLSWLSTLSQLTMFPWVWEGSA